MIVDFAVQLFSLCFVVVVAAGVVILGSAVTDGTWTHTHTD